MTTVLIEVTCRWDPVNPIWETVQRLIVEIGYPGRDGHTIWKHIGWLQDNQAPTGRSFIHAIWNQKTADQKIKFEFLPVYGPNPKKPNQTYRIRKTLTYHDGRQQRFQSRILRENYQDEMITVHPEIQEDPSHS